MKNFFNNPAAYIKLFCAAFFVFIAFTNIPGCKEYRLSQDEIIYPEDLGIMITDSGYISAPGSPLSLNELKIVNIIAYGASPYDLIMSLGVQAARTEFKRAYGDRPLLHATEVDKTFESISGPIHGIRITYYIRRSSQSEPDDNIIVLVNPDSTGEDIVKIIDLAGQ